jgi:hypothetical protein
MKKTFVSLVLLCVLFGLGILRPLVGWAEQNTPNEFAQGVEYSLLMSKDDKVCKHMLALFNQDLSQFGTEKYNEHDEFRSIGWKKEAITRMEGDREVTDFVEAAHVDIDNDGMRDLVFRQTQPFGGYDRQTLNIFPNLVPNEKRWTLMEIAKSAGRIDLYLDDYQLQQRGNGGKRLKSMNIPPASSHISVINPFQYGGVTYLSMRPLYELAAGSDERLISSRIHVIGKYRQGRFGWEGSSKRELGEIDDVCYYKVRTKLFISGGQ